MAPAPKLEFTNHGGTARGGSGRHWTAGDGRGRCCGYRWMTRLWRGNALKTPWHFEPEALSHNHWYPIHLLLNLIQILTSLFCRQRMSTILDWILSKPLSDIWLFKELSFEQVFIWLGNQPRLLRTFLVYLNKIFLKIIIYFRGFVWDEITLYFL